MREFLDRLQGVMTTPGVSHHAIFEPRKGVKQGRREPVGITEPQAPGSPIWKTVGRILLAVGGVGLVIIVIAWLRYGSLEIVADRVFGGGDTQEPGPTAPQHADRSSQFHEHLDNGNLALADEEISDCAAGGGDPDQAQRMDLGLAAAYIDVGDLDQSYDRLIDFLNSEETPGVQVEPDWVISDYVDRAMGTAYQDSAVSLVDRYLSKFHRPAGYSYYLLLGIGYREAGEIGKARDLFSKAATGGSPDVVEEARRHLNWID